MTRPVNASLLFLVAAALCFAIALLSAVGVVTTDAIAWAFGGALAYILSLLL